MNRNKFLLATSALAISFFAADALADGVTSCGDISQIRYMLQKYATNDPSNYCIRATTLAESYPCMREEVLRESNAVARKNGLASVVVGCPAAVVQAPPPVQYVPAPQPQYVQYVPVQQGYVQPIPQAQTIERVAGPVIVQGSRVTGSHAGLFAGSALLWGGLGLLVAGGTAAALITSGGGSSTTTTTTGGTTTTDFITDEYRAQYSLTTMDAASAYQRGYAGAGVQVAVLDTGLDVSHSEFTGRVTPGNGYDFVTNAAGQPAAINLNSHGTEVAGIINANRNFVGMHGVAYDATVVPLRVFDSTGGAIASFESAINYARTNTQAKILNGSYGPDDAWHNNFEPLGYQGIVTTPEIAEADAYLAYVAAGGMLVFPAGNAYLIAPGLASNPTGPGFLPFIRPANANIVGAANGAYRDELGNVMATADYSALEAQTIVVAGVDRNNVISTFSNRCGVAMNWCMVAPDENIFTTTTGGGYTTVSGTSFAAPQVAGALAILKQEFPNLTAAQLVSRLLNTATDLGDAGVDAIYGHGLLNLAAASNPIGVTGISTTGLLAGNIVPITSSTLSYGNAFGGSIANAFNGVNVLVLDSYNAAFMTGLRGRVASSTSNFDARNAVSKFDRQEERQEFSFGDNAKVSFRAERNSDSANSIGDKPKDTNDNDISLRSFSLSTGIAGNAEGSVHYKDSQALALGFSEADRARMDRAINKDALTNPYASFASEGFASVYKTKGLGGTVKIAGFYGHNKSDDEASNFGTQAELGYNFDKGTDAFVQLGTLFEENRVLGSKGTGALAFGNGTSTVFMGVGGKMALDGGLTLRAHGYAGMTNPSLNADNSLIKSSSEIITSSFNAAVEKAGSFLKGDTLGLGVSQPLRVESGSMQFDIPVAMNSNYTSLISRSFTQDLSAQGREVDMEVNYAVPVGTAESLAAGALYRMDAGHVVGKTDIMGVMRWSKKF